MSSSLRVIVVCATLVTWLPAQALFLGPSLEINVGLTKQDLDIIHHTVNDQVHGKAIGTTAKWSNPESQNSGKIARQEIHAKRPAMRDPRLQVDN
jgi:hypothetical protein